MFDFDYFEKAQAKREKKRKNLRISRKFGTPLAYIYARTLELR
ncbi:hypothetical protein LEP1GSC016_0852 [Leptospira borgpetersenii serovar Hardjo-bovis str. Sponselee]|uniref:Uncharacterized protein n=1 Tax=Leptospira borgpetersenii serovar Hardjo-bovis str. Sponselee TaxID=1303729 RepID=M6BPG7_LEPBO|nr:hypothetical protein LEP1GSC016_0852 [Leptospira borgpetersenii serovar Hardjo-bovis str. Sponselee]